MKILKKIGFTLFLIVINVVVVYAEDVTPIAEIANFCNEERAQHALRFIGYLLMVVKIIVPLLLIIFGVIDYAKAVIASDDKTIKNSTSSFVTRIAAGVLIFLLPTIINFVFGLVAGANTSMKYEKCRICIFNPKECGKMILTSKS